ncbi:MAG: hypothetical protein AAGA91_13855 [Pseudomonadota bacterium]
MLSTLGRLTGIAALFAALTPAAIAIDVDADYFTGHWKINADCKKDDAEYMLLRANGTFEYGRRGTAEAVGFWATSNHVLDMEMLAAPASFQDIQADLANQTSRDIYTMQVLPYDYDNNGFEAVAGIGDEMGMVIWKRCK